MEKKRQNELSTLLKTNDRLGELSGSENSVSISLTSGSEDNAEVT